MLLLDIGGNWNTLSNTSIQGIRNMLMSGEYTGHGRTGTFLKHEVMAADEWHDNGPQDLCVTVSLCIQIAIAKMQLCSLSVAYA
jgi:hypothetical protein